MGSEDVFLNYVIALVNRRSPLEEGFPFSMCTHIGVTELR